MEILTELDEKPLRDIKDSILITDMVIMNTTLQQLSDNHICNMQDNQSKRSVTLNKLYADLAHILHYVNPTLVAAVSLRMVELTMSEGISPTAPLAFAHYGEVLTSMGNINEGCRLGELICILFILLESDILPGSEMTWLFV